MKTGLLIFFITIPVWATMNLTEGLKIKQVDHCQVKQSSFPPNTNIELDIHCEIQCSGSDGKTLKFPLTYSTAREELSVGNGTHQNFQMYGFFLQRMKNLAQQECLSRAVDECKDLNKVENSQLIGIDHNLWEKMWRPPTFCSDEEIEVFPLPYRPSLVHNQIIKNQDKKQIEIASSEQDIFYQLPKEDLSCQQWIRIDVCYGDCMPMSGEFKAILHEPGKGMAQDELFVCADPILEKINESYSPQVKVQLCQLMTWQAIFQQRRTIMGTTCSAFRGQTNCQSLFTP